MSEGIALIDEVNVEDYARRGQPLPRARHYRIRVDKITYVVDKSVLTGMEILGLAGKTSKTHNLYQILRGHQPTPVGNKAEVDLHAPGVERFTTVPLDPTEGEEAPTLRREFALGENDQEFLNNLGLLWETIKDNGSLWLVLHQWKLPEGYNVATASLALRIPEGYPDTQIDMAYFEPPLARADRRSINNLSDLPLWGKTYQQWSRHRTGANPWRPNEDDVASHLALVDDWLRREFKEG
jgi:hypothetical protein